MPPLLSPSANTRDASRPCAATSDETSRVAKATSSKQVLHAQREQRRRVLQEAWQYELLVLGRHVEESPFVPTFHPESCPSAIPSGKATTQPRAAAVETSGACCSEKPLALPPWPWKLRRSGPDGGTHGRVRSSVRFIAPSVSWRIGNVHRKGWPHGCCSHRSPYIGACMRPYSSSPRPLPFRSGGEAVSVPVRASPRPCRASIGANSVL
mmetsp:Transcript_38469/g.125116  ORF Transcript_38469/g.125116 Transcript_38469/m.125116 type:complete len:210 (+) Transcript_38469:271-900(+)